MLLVGLPVAHVAPLLNLSPGFFLYVLICEVALNAIARILLFTESFVVSWIEECRQFSLVLLDPAAPLIAWRRDTDRGSTL